MSGWTEDINLYAQLQQAETAQTPNQFNCITKMELCPENTSRNVPDTAIQATD